MDKEEKEQKKNIRTMDIILLIVSILAVSFTVTMIIVFCKYQMIPDVLVTCVFTALFGECGIMGWIKITKVKNTTQTPIVDPASVYNASIETTNSSPTTTAKG